ncbi:aminopeptidase, partial [Neisseria elongata]|uniref:aminopeptidase n=1 Tax=Neisseria elongata TaxID=495 RepID=UPI0036235A55
MNAGFRTQQAVGVFAFHADGGAVDARDFAVVFFEDFDFEAEQGYKILKQLLDTDEGSRRIGEVALVPNDSPISNSGLLYYQTLFD